MGNKRISIGAMNNKICPEINVDGQRIVYAVDKSYIAN